MPYFLVKVVGMKDAYYVKDTKGKYYSKKPLPLKVAREQLLALHIHTGH
jgi:hypothetical protein